MVTHMPMILHTVNQSPFHSSVLQECLHIAGEFHGVLLLEDGVYGALKSNPQAQSIETATKNVHVKFYLLKDDLKARGLEEINCLTCIQPIDYAEFVNLTTQYKSVQSWY